MKKIRGIAAALAVCFAICMMPVSAQAADTAATTKPVELKTSATALNLNAGQSVDVTVSVTASLSAIEGYLMYDRDVFAGLPVVTVSSGSGSGSWSVTYDENSHILSAQYYGGTTNSTVTLNNSVLLTLHFTSQKTVTSTTISLDHPILTLAGGSKQYADTQSLTLTNTQAKVITLSPVDVSGDGRVSVPVRFKANSGFSKLTLSAAYDKSVLTFESITRASSVSSALAQSAYTLASGGGSVSVTFSASTDVNTTGDLFYVNFTKAAGTASSSSTSSTATSTTVKFTVDSVQNKAGDAFTVSGAEATVSISDKGHTLGDVNGDGEINLVDALYVVMAYNGTKTLTSAEQTAADVNKDGKVTLADARKIIQYYNKAITSFS